MKCVKVKMSKSVLSRRQRLPFTRNVTRVILEAIKGCKYGNINWRKLLKEDVDLEYIYKNHQEGFKTRVKRMRNGEVFEEYEKRVWVDVDTNVWSEYVDGIILDSKRRKKSSVLEEGVKMRDSWLLELYEIKLESEKFGVESEKFGVESEKFGVESEKFGVESEKSVLESEKFEVESKKSGVETEKFGVESEKSVLESEKSVLESGKSVETEKSVLESEKSVLEVRRLKERVEVFSKAMDRDKTKQESTKLTYLMNIRKMDEYGMLRNVNEAEETIKAMEEHYSRVTIKRNIFALASLLRQLELYEFNGLFEKNYKLEEKTDLEKGYRILGDCYDVKKERGVKSEKQEKNWMTREELLKVLYKCKEELKKLGRKATRNEIQFYVALSLLVNQNALRNDFSSVKIRNYNVEVDNYLDVCRGVFVFNNFKTAREWNSRQEYVVKEEAKEALEMLLNERKEDEEWLFMDSKGCMMTKNNFGKLMILNMQRKTGKSVGSQMIRNIQVTHENKSGMKIGEKMEMARQMMHSAITAEKVYNKNKKE